MPTDHLHCVVLNLITAEAAHMQVHLCENILIPLVFEVLALVHLLLILGVLDLHLPVIADVPI